MSEVEAFNETEYGEKLDLFITEAEDNAKIELDTAVEPEPSGDTEAESDDMSSDTTQEDMWEDERSGKHEDELAAGDPDAKTLEDGAEGDTGEAEVVEPAAPAVEPISDDVLTIAVQSGIPLAEARRFHSEEALLSVAEKLSEAAGNKLIAEQAKEPDTDPLDALKLDPEEFRPEVIAMFEGMKAVIREQNEKIAASQESQDAAIKSSQAASQAASDAEINQWFDAEIKGLGESFADALGTGGHGDLARGSSQLAKRDEIATKCVVLNAGYQSSGIQSPPRGEIFQEAARLVLSDEYKAADEKQVTDGLKKQAGQHMQRANGKRNKTKQDSIAEIGAEIDSAFASN
jgi:hypothetical protein